MRERWPISNGKRRKIIHRLMGVVLHGDDDKAIAAASALIRCDAINVQHAKPAPVRQSLTIVNQGINLPADQRSTVLDAARILMAPVKPAE